MGDMGLLVGARLSDGLPICHIRYVDFDGRRAVIHDRDACVWFPNGTTRRYKLLAGEPTADVFEHPYDSSMVGIVEKEEADEIETLEPCWVIAEQWVLTGVLEVTP